MAINNAVEIRRDIIKRLAELILKDNVQEI